MTGSLTSADTKPIAEGLGRGHQTPQEARASSGAVPGSEKLSLNDWATLQAIAGQQVKWAEVFIHKWAPPGDENWSSGRWNWLD